jgi:hypothetical protein
MEKKTSIIGLIGAIWGLAGVLALLSSATLRLWPKAVEAFSYPFDWYHWAVLVAIVIAMAYAEGYKGFQKAFSPRTAARARHILHNPRFLHVALAPLFCMGYFHATRRRMTTSISLTIGIIALIVLVYLVPQPWRGIIDAGVVVGLAWGIVSLLAFSFQAMGRGSYPYSPEVPDEV